MVGSISAGAKVAGLSGVLLLVSFSALAQSLVDDLGSFEREALQRALTERDLTIETSPENKTLDIIHVMNLDVLQPADGFLQIFNALHVTTKEHVIRREVLLQPGMRWDEAKVFETKRNLRDRTFTTAVVAVPVQNEDPELVDLLVVTRDVWSLRLNTDFDFQQGTFRRLSFSVSENNLFGYRKRLSGTFAMDLGSIFVGPNYFDSNISGSRLTFSHRSGLFISREDGEVEGSLSDTSFQLPLWALDREWGAGIQVSHVVRVARSFLGTELRSYDNPDTTEIEAVPRLFRDRQVAVDASVTRSFPGKVINRFTLGYRLTWLGPQTRLPEGIDAQTRSAFIRDVLPREETRSGVRLAYQLFTPRFHIYRNINTFDFPEDVRSGPELNASITLSPTFLGSTTDSLIYGLSGRWLFAWSGDGYSSIEVLGSGRLAEDGLVDNLLEAISFSALPTVFDLFRLVLSARGSVLLDETTNRFLAAGGDVGLRGFEAGLFTGDRRILLNVEARTLPVKLWFFRLGGVLFYDGGHAWGTGSGLPSQTTAPDLNWQSNVGLGLRYVAPQTDTTVWRLDFAVPVTGPTAGFEGLRFSASLGQFF